MEIGSIGIAAANATPKYESKMRSESVANMTFVLVGMGGVRREGEDEQKEGQW